MDLNNRELATLFWLAVILVLVIAHPSARSHLPGLIKAAVAPVIVISLLAMVAYTILLVRVGTGVGLWTSELMKGTVVWFLVSGLVLFYKVTEADQPGFFRRTLLRVLGVTIVIEFLMNLFVMNFWLELLLQPWLFLWIAIEIVSKDDPEKAPARKLAGSLISLTGLALAVYIAIQLATNWRSLFTPQKLLEFDLPIWLTIGLLPFVYLLSVFVAYDHAIRHVLIGVEGRRNRLRVILALLTSVFGRRKLRNIRYFHASRAARATTFKATRQLFKGESARVQT